MVDRNASERPEYSITFRIGINLGDVIVEETDIFGDGVNVAARLEGLAEPGGICISRAVHEQVQDKLRYFFTDLGGHSIKNIARPVHVYGLSAGAVALLPREIAIPKPRTPAPWTAGRSVTIAVGLIAVIAVASGAWWFWAMPQDAPPFVAIVQSKPAPPNLGTANLVPTPAAPNLEIELAFWKTIQDSATAADFEDYLQRYPTGVFASLAQRKLDALKKSQQAMTVPPPLPPPSAPAVQDLDATFIVLRTAKIRDEPSATAKELGTLLTGTTVEVTGRADNVLVARDVEGGARLCVGVDAARSGRGRDRGVGQGEGDEEGGRYRGVPQILSEGILCGAGDCTSGRAARVSASRFGAGAGGAGRGSGREGPGFDDA